MVNHGAAGRFGYPDPIADRREVGGTRRLMAKPAADFGDSIERTGDAISAALFFDDAHPAQVVTSNGADLI
jgi:hypothetical protein